MSTSDGAQISTSDAPAPAGAYSQGRRIGPFLQVSGQLGLGEGAVTVSQQTELALRHVTAILDAGGATWADVLTVRAFIADDDLFDEFDATYAAVVPQPYPARVTVAVGLAPGALVEIDALAVLDRS